MNIQEIREIFKYPERVRDLVTVIVFLVATVSSFFLGRASVTQDTIQIGEVSEISHIITTTETQVEPTPKEKPEKASIYIEKATGEKGYVASKSGSKYHLPWCSGAKTIKEENKIWFATKEEAEAAGYTPAANCKGI